MWLLFQKAGCLKSSLAGHSILSSEKRYFLACTPVFSQRKVHEELIWENCAKDPEATPLCLSLPSSLPPPSPLTLQSCFVVEKCTHSMFIPAALVKVGYSA